MTVIVKAHLWGPSKRPSISFAVRFNQLSWLLYSELKAALNSRRHFSKLYNIGNSPLSSTYWIFYSSVILATQFEYYGHLQRPSEVRRTSVERTWVSRVQRIVQWTIRPANGLATEDQPWAFKRCRIASRRRASPGPASEAGWAAVWWAANAHTWMYGLDCKRSMECELQQA